MMNLTIERDKAQDFISSFDPCISSRQSSHGLLHGMDGAKSFDPLPYTPWFEVLCPPEWLDSRATHLARNSSLIEMHGGWM